MGAREDRLAQLRQLLHRNGLELSSSDEGIQLLNDWFRNEVEGDQASGRLLPYWYAVVNDIALFLGDVIIERCPSLHWVMFDKGAKDVAFQRHVIMGFTGVTNPKYNIDIDSALATYGHRLVAGHPVERDAFVIWVSSAQAKA